MSQNSLAEDLSMKLGHVVKAGLLVGAFASAVQAQSLTGSIGGNALSQNGTNGVVSGPVCDISGIPTQLPAGRSCSFLNSGAAANGSIVSINGTATVTWDAGINAYIYQLGYSFSGNARQGTTNVQFAFDIPLFNQFFNTGSSSIAVTVSRPGRGTTSFADGAPVGPVMNVTSFNGINNGGSYGLNLNPAVSVTRISGPAVSNTVSLASGTQNVNAWVDRNLVQFGFDVTNTSDDPAGFSGSGAIVFTSNVVPEPSTYALFATGLVGLLVAARRRRSV